MAEAEAREMQLEPAVEPHAGLVLVDRPGLDAAHATARTSAQPAASAAIERTTEPNT